MRSTTERHLAGHLRFLEDGQVLASWRLSPLRRPSNEREAAQVARAHRELLRACAGHRIWIESLLIWSDPSEIANAMIAGVDLAANPNWAETTDAAIDVLEAEGLGRRRFMLSVKLNLSSLSRFKCSALAAANDSIERLSMTPIPPSEQLLAAAAAEARKIERAIPGSFAPRRMTSADVVWTRRHAWGRTGADLVDPMQAPELANELLEGANGLGRIHLNPNGIASSNLAEKGIAAVHNRWIGVSDDRGVTSYQAGMVISQIPRDLAWPTTEFLGRIDDAGVPVDLTITGQVRTSSEAIRKSTKAMKQLGDQTNQVTGDDGEGAANQAAHQVRLGDASQIAMDYTADLTRDRTLVEIEPVILLSVAADSPDVADQMAKDYMDADATAEFGIARPIGQEEAMFWARQPGGVPTAELNNYRQLSHSAGGLGQSALITSSDLGDETGIPLALNEGSSLRSLVLLEPFGLGSTYRKKSPSIATAGDQGGGKTHFAKTFAGHMVDRGARLIATDTSDEGEWVTFAKSLNTSLAVVDFTNPTCSIDPMRTLPTHLAGPVMQSFLSTLLDIDATGTLGRTLAKALKASYLAEHHIESAGQLIQHLGKITKSRNAAGLDVEAAHELADRVAVFADVDDASGIARVVFDPALPAMDIETQCNIWRMHGVQLPTTEELTNPKLFEQMSIEKRLGRATYALYAKHTHVVADADEHRPALQNVDEFHHMHSSPEALKAQSDYLRIGRHKDKFWHGQSQKPIDFGGLGGLVRTRVITRLSTEADAIDAAAFLGKTAPADPTKEKAEDADERLQLAQEILAHNARGDGAAMMRDHKGQIGPVQLLLPFTQERRDAASTSHKETSQEVTV